LEGRIGLIVPSSNTTMKVDYSRLAPEGISIHTSRIHFKGASSTEELAALLKHVNDAVKLLVNCRPNVIVWGCTAASIVPGFEKGVKKIIEADYGVPCVMPLSAAVAAFRALSISRISLTAPYTEEILEGVRRYLEKQRSMCCKCKRVRAQRQPYYSGAAASNHLPTRLISKLKRRRRGLHQLHQP